jgi:hypothetical protein
MHFSSLDACYMFGLSRPAWFITVIILHRIYTNYEDPRYTPVIPLIVPNTLLNTSPSRKRKCRT